MTTGFENLFIGSNAGAANTTGSRNIFIGAESGALGATAGTDNIAIGNNTSFGQNVTNSVVIGSYSFSSLSNKIFLGNNQQDTIVSGKLVVSLVGTAGGTQLCRNISNEIANCSSSIRYKKDIEDYAPGLDLVRRLRPVSFTWKDGGMRDVGFVAEEVAAVEPLMTTTNEKGETEGVKYDRISTALVNAVNEQQTQIEEQQTQIGAQKKQIEDQQALIQKQQEQLTGQQKQIDALLKIVCARNPQAESCRENK
jgi:hypothetical protein